MDQVENASLPDLLSVSELAEYLGVPLSTIYLWRVRGEGPPGFKVGKQVRYRVADVANWLDTKRGEEAPMP
jgi:excisionase family DNA binding protein